MTMHSDLFSNVFSGKLCGKLGFRLMLFFFIPPPAHTKVEGGGGCIDLLSFDSVIFMVTEMITQN